MQRRKSIRIKPRPLLLFLYLCEPFTTMVITRLVPMSGISKFAPYFTISVLMMGYLSICAIRRRLLIPEFWVLYIVIIMFFSLTYLIHPEYEPWYMRPDFGVWNYVLRPDNGLFLYLFIRLVDDPKKIKSTIKYSGWVMYVYFGLRIFSFLRRGYWIDVSNTGFERHMSYNLSLGYDVLLFALAFLYCALEDKKKSDLIGAVTGIAIILIAGSRGPFLDIAIFFIIYILIKIVDNRNRAKYIAGTVIAFLLLWVLFPYLVVLLSSFLEGFNIKSRFLTTFINGSLTDDNQRISIWNAAVDMIKQNPFGYGAMGSRHVLSQFIYVAHPHQIFLELLIDFGVFIGTLIIAWLIFSSIRVFTVKGQDEWKGVFLIFFSRACQLLVSLTFWHSIGVWGTIAVGMCMLRAKRKGRSIPNGR